MNFLSYLSLIETSLALCSGFFLVVIIHIYYKSKSIPVLRYFLLTAGVLFGVVLFSQGASLTYFVAGHGCLPTLFALGSLFFSQLIIFSTPLFSDMLISGHFSGEKRILYGSIYACSLVSLILLAVRLFTGRHNLLLPFILATVPILLVALYSSLDNIRIASSIENALKRKFVREISLANLIFFPFFLMDASVLYFFFQNKVAFINPFVTFYFLLCTFNFSIHILSYQRDKAHFPLCIDSPEGLLTDPRLSAREKEIVNLMMNGFSNQEIGDSLVISLSTVKTHNQNIFRKLGIQKRYELLNLYFSTK